MRTIQLVQAVILMSIVAIAASCAGAKTYTSRLFPRQQADSPGGKSLTIRFLEMENLEINPGGWVQTDLVNGKDSTNPTLAIDRLARTVPAAGYQPVKSPVKEAADTTRSEPVARSVPGNTGSRNKRSRDEQ